MTDPFRYFNSSPEIIRLTVMMYIRYPLSLRQVEDLLFERSIDLCHEGIVTLTGGMRENSCHLLFKPPQPLFFQTSNASFRNHLNVDRLSK